MANLFMRREFALEGRIDFRPLFVVIGFNLATGFASYVVFNTLAEHSMADGAIALGSSISPSVQRMASLSVDPSRCAFVLSVQWILALLYLPLLLFVYWPFSKVIRVAVREWRKRQPSESIGDNRALAFYAFFALLIPWALGDLGIIGFPTLYNGIMLAGGEPLRPFVAMINSALCLPLLAWFCAFASPMVYWSAIYAMANWRSLV